MGTQTAVTPRGSSGTAPATNPLMNFTPMVVICAILYFLIIRPQQKQAKDHRKLVDTLKNGDRVLTQGGIYGTVVGLKDGIVQVKIADNVRVEVSRSAISQVITEATKGNGTPVITTGDRIS